MIGKIAGSFVQFPGILVTLFLLLWFVRKKKKYIIFAAILYLFTIEVVWIPVEKLWVVDEKVVAGDILILGGGVLETPDGVQLSRATLSRLLKGFELWKELRSRVIVSGGRTPSGFIEAEKMKEVLISWGVPENMVIVEGNSINTYENILYSKNLTNEPVNIVTSSTHTVRVKLIADKLNVDSAVIPCDFIIETKVTYRSFLPSQEALSFPGYLTHEIFGIIYYKLKGVL
ncbi:MAG: YdcF family protein [Thermotogaceae bacterium]|nr:YdcF family protein [Thermotogaceae bacterium]